MSRPVVPGKLPAPWGHKPDAHIELEARRLRALYERMDRAERRAERRATLLTALFILTAAAIGTVVEWAVYVTAVRP